MRIDSQKKKRKVYAVAVNYSEIISSFPMVLLSSDLIKNLIPES